MTVNVSIYENDKWINYQAYNSVDFDERLDEQLDTGRVLVINNSIVPFNDMSMVKLTISDGNENKTMYYYGFDTVEKRAKDYYIHTIDLVEPTRLLMGRFIDGKRVTQPILGIKKTLLNVLNDLLAVSKLLENGENAEFSFAYDKLVNNTISPEFYWASGTSLWECLCDIGNVIDCIPRLSVSSNDDGYSLIIKYDKINNESSIYEM